MRTRNLSCTLKTLRAEQCVDAEARCGSARDGSARPPRRSSQVPTNCSISTSTPNRPARKPRSREADFACGAISPANGELLRVRHRAEPAVGRRADADERSEIGSEAVEIGPVVLRDRPRIRPGAEEQLQEAVVQDVEEARERVVAVERPGVRLLGRRRAAARPAARAARGTSRTAGSGPGRRGSALLDVRGREVEERVLAEHHVLLAPRGAVADARLLLEAPLEAPQHGEEVEPPGLGLEALSR